MAIVTISRECGTGGETIGRAVAKKLGYEYFDKKAIFRDLEEHGKQWVRWGKEMDEHCPTVWERFDRSFAGVVALLENCIFQHALKDHVVIMGRGGNWLLKDVPYALRVRISGPIEERIRRVCDREDVNRETAERMIEFSDHERSCYVRSVYRRDVSDSGDYDLVLNLGKLRFDEVVGLIVDEIPARDKLATKEARENLRRMAAAANVKAEASTDFRVFVPTLEVFHDGTAIVVRGIVDSKEELERLREIAIRTAAQEKVRIELHYRGA
jgi:cytidylate kinase